MGRIIKSNSLPLTGLPKALWSNPDSNIKHKRTASISVCLEYCYSSTYTCSDSNIWQTRRQSLTLMTTSMRIKAPILMHDENWYHHYNFLPSWWTVLVLLRQHVFTYRHCYNLLESAGVFSQPRHHASAAIYKELISSFFVARRTCSLPFSFLEWFYRPLTQPT